MRALTTEEARLVSGCPVGADDLPSRRGAADLVRSILTATGSLQEDRLIAAVGGMAGLGGGAEGAPGLLARVASVLEQMVAAGELLRLCGDETLVWLATPADIALADGTTLGLGRDGRDAAADQGQIFPEASVADAVSLRDHLGPPSFRYDVRSLGFANWREASPEDLPPRSEPLSQRMDDPVLPTALDAWRGVPPFSQTTSTPDFAGLPEQVRRALALAGRPQNDQLGAWTLSPELAGDLQEWIGRSAEPEALDPEEADPSQMAVIMAPAGARLVVEAGPGSGKTRVACSRIARLIDDGGAASRFLMVSFTQAAVGELRQRIGDFLTDPAWAGDVQILTLDSLAGGFRVGFGDSAPPSGFEGGIDAALDLFRREDRGLTDYLRSFEHVVIDEAQDMTGLRQDLIFALVASLAGGCGVTLFEDPAQAIYGWRDGADGTLSGALLSDPALRFARLTLGRDHRTRDPALRLLKAELRTRLSDSGDPEEIYLGVRSAIETAAEPSSILTSPGAASRSTLVLFRSRGELLRAASRFWRDGAPVRVRLTERDKAVVGWVGALLRASVAQTLSRSDLDGLWDQLWPRPATLSSDEAWRRLRSAAGSGRNGVDLARLAVRLASASPPAQLIVAATGRTGPVLSTIHGSKGQEAEHVVLALPRTPGAPTLEEARILFVAATRARTSFSITAARPSGAPARGRVWLLRGEERALIEIGRDGDVDRLRTAFPEGENEAITEARQQALWRISDTPTPVRATRTGAGWALFADGGAADGVDLGFLSSTLVGDLYAIGRERHAGRVPGASLRGLFVAGVQTVTQRPLEGPPRFGLVPVIAGLATVYFNVPPTGAKSGEAV